MFIVVVRVFIVIVVCVFVVVVVVVCLVAVFVVVVCVVIVVVTEGDDFDAGGCFDDAAGGGDVLDGLEQRLFKAGTVDKDEVGIGEGGQIARAWLEAVGVGSGGDEQGQIDVVAADAVDYVGKDAV